ncbi:MAG: response regulator transcription factor [Cyanobacteria bacterium P01_H01_bin.15]
MKILVLEDDEQLQGILTGALSEQRHLVETATDGRQGWEMLEFSPYDLLILDLRLPEVNGLEVCRRVRDRRIQTPILILTALDESDDKVRCLDAGADDYVVKPFDLPEFLARVRSMLRRGSSAPPLLQWGALELDPNACNVTYSGKPLELTAKEFALLELFLRNPNQVFSRSAVLDRVWAFEDFPTEDAVKALVKRLRQKLVRCGAPADTLETVYGLGYRLKSLSGK